MAHPDLLKRKTELLVALDRFLTALIENGQAEEAKPEEAKPTPQAAEEIPLALLQELAMIMLKAPEGKLKLKKILSSLSLSSLSSAPKSLYPQLEEALRG